MGDLLCCFNLQKRMLAKKKRKHQQANGDCAGSSDSDKGDNTIMSEEVKRKIYYTAEFESVGDVTRSGNLTYMEFLRLINLLRFPGGREGGKQLWHSLGKSEGGRMTIDEYRNMMVKHKIDSKTNMWRNMFSEFDWSGNGYASKEDVLKGLQNMGLNLTPQLRNMVDAMDEDGDGQVSYADFLREQLKLD